MTVITPRSIRVLIATALVLLLSACTTSGTQVAAKRSAQSVEAYLNALDAMPGDTRSIDEGLARFKMAYADLTQPDIGELVEQIYAPDLFFNDTVHTFEDRNALKAYMQKTGENLSQSEVIIHQVIQQQADVFVRWTMTFVVGEDESAIRSTSIGISHLRFNAEGQVILHQDYWDSASALYAHLPIVGMVIRAAQDRLAQ